VEGWRNRWLPNGASPPPVLELRNESMRNGSVRNGSVRNGSVRNGSTRNGTNGPVVFDTRGDTPKEHDIGTVGLRVLAALGTSRYVNDLERELSDVSAREVQASLQALESAGLLYSEKGRYLSLVLPNEGGATDAHFDATLQRTASTSSVVDGFET
jgi:hypothetical protein